MVGVRGGGSAHMHPVPRPKVDQIRFGSDQVWTRFGSDQGRIRVQPGLLFHDLGVCALLLTSRTAISRYTQRRFIKDFLSCALLQILQTAISRIKHRWSQKSFYGLPKVCSAMLVKSSAHLFFIYKIGENVL